MQRPGFLVRARELSAGYGPTVALRDVSCELPRGQVAVVLGPGGSGKSTLLRTLRRDVEPFPQLWWRGELEVPAFPLCLLPQRLEALSTSLRDHLGHACGSRTRCACSSHCTPGVESTTPEEHIETIWAEAGDAVRALQGCLDEPLDRLAPGLRRLARLTVHLSLGAPLLLLDEPEVGLELVERQWLARLCRGLGERVSLVVVTHHLGFAREIADIAMLLVDGELVELGPAESFFAHPDHPRTQSYLRTGS